MPVRVLERGMLLHKCPLLTWEAMGSSHQAGGWEIRVSSKIWFLMEGEWCWWVVVQPWSCGDIRMGAPQAPPKCGRRLWTAHAAAAGGIHLLPVLSTLQRLWLVIDQASEAEEEQRGKSSKSYRIDFLPKQQLVCRFYAVADLLLWELF